jgi:hypothetical protein
LIEVDKAQADFHLLNLILLIFTILLIIKPIVSLKAMLHDDDLLGSTGDL